MNRRSFPRFGGLALALATATIILTVPRGASAAEPEPSTIVLTAPANANLGERITVQARLTSSAGPIAKATVDFVIPTAFLHNQGDMVVARGVTDGDGLAVAEFEARMTGVLQVKAVFRGNDSYAAANGSAPLSVSGSKQLYLPDTGIRVRGVNSAPIGGEDSLGHWLLSGWPIGAVLLLVWSLYGVAVFFMSRISADADRALEAHQ